MKGRRIFALSALLAVVWLFVALFFSAAMGIKTASADEAEYVATYEASSEIIESGIVENEDKNAEENPTVFSRVEEWFSHYFLEFMASVDLLAVVGCITAVVFEKRSNKKNTRAANTVMGENTAELKRNTESNDEVLKVSNLLIDRVNSLAESDETRDVNITQLLSLDKAILEILVTVYVNNKNLPQATKDLVNLKYVNALKGGESETPCEVKEVSEG